MKKKKFIILAVSIVVLIAMYVVLKPKTIIAPMQKEEQQMPVLNTFQVEGNKEDLVSFSIAPGQEVSGTMKVTGVIKGYYFEGSFPVIILDENKNKTPYGPGFATATEDWMTNKPVPFVADFDFSGMPKGKYYIKLMQDDPSGGESGVSVRFVLIPIIIK